MKEQQRTKATRTKTATIFIVFICARIQVVCLVGWILNLGHPQLLGAITRTATHFNRSAVSRSKFTFSWFQDY